MGKSFGILVKNDVCRPMPKVQRVAEQPDPYQGAASGGGACSAPHSALLKYQCRADSRQQGGPLQEKPSSFQPEKPAKMSRKPAIDLAIGGK